MYISDLHTTFIWSLVQSTKLIGSILICITRWQLNALSRILIIVFIPNSCCVDRFGIYSIGALSKFIRGTRLDEICMQPAQMGQASKWVCRERVKNKSFYVVEYHSWCWDCTWMDWRALRIFRWLTEHTHTHRHTGVQHALNWERNYWKLSFFYD